jgi:transposase-like protein
MTNESYYTLFEEIIEDLQGGGKDSLTKTISTLMNVAMKIEQEKALQASPYERNEERTGQRNGYKDKTLKNPCRRNPSTDSPSAWYGVLPRSHR